ncbi:MAG: TonB-dependent receptor [Bacteroidota bacterium]|nr:TonB-dependent receptor [Bacteroidota bacterium]
MRTYTLIYILLIIITAQGQDVDDTVSLDRVDISASRLTPNAGFKISKIDSLSVQDNIYNNLGDLLAMHSTMYIKSYGQGGISTASFRGTGASHTQVYWNGLKLTSPMLGETDLSTIPNAFSDDISLDYGGSSLARGSGGFGGAISIDNQPDWDRRVSLNLMQSFGSFRTFHTLAGFGVGNQKLQSNTRIFHQQSTNDFTYVNRDKPGEPVEKRENAAYRNTGLFQEFYFRIKKDQVLSAKIWAQWNNREVPASTLVAQGVKNEHMEQQFVRSVLDWKKYFAKGFLDIRAGYFYDSDQYQNEEAHINTRNTVHSAYLKAGMGKTFSSNFSLKGEISHTYYHALSPNLDGSRTQNQSAVYVNGQYKLKNRFFADLILRQELIDENFSPLLPSLGLEYHLLKSEDLRIKGNISRNYRVPTLNDLYWGFDGFSRGNPDLLPENGFSSDLGLRYQMGKPGKYKLDAEITAFYILIDDMIFWRPWFDGITVWTPLNLKEVESTGIEINLDFDFQFNRHRFVIMPAYTCTRSIIKGSDETINQSLGKQLIYVPIHKAVGSLRYIIGSFRISYNIRCFGKRYTVADNSRYLPAQVLNDLMIEKQFIINKFTLSTQLNIDNIWDEEYQVVVRQPMPGRSFMLTIKFMFNQ